MIDKVIKTAEYLSKKPNWKMTLMIMTIVILTTSVFYYFFIKPPANFPLNSIYSVEENRTLSQIVNTAKKNNLIKSSLMLKILMTLFSGNRGVISGDYVLNKKENVFQIAQRFSDGDYRLSAVRVTVQEGLNVYGIVELLSNKDDFPNFNRQEFISLAKNREGYLYPDTYFFLPSVKADKIIETMEQNFKNKIASIHKDIKKFGKTFEDVLTMASIIEKEVPKMEDRKIVAGILWKRIKIGMPLQIDAVFPYITQRKGGIITREDLKIDSPYNTYLNKGLPPGPISNPSLDAIIATINPQETKYLFYISDKKGVTRFATNLDEHNANINKYLK